MEAVFTERWRDTFWRVAQEPGYAAPLRTAALNGQLADWTRTMTALTVATCRGLGWQASAKDHHLDLLPIPHFEYLTIDVMAFADGEKRWRFPVAAIELENSAADDRIAYSLWKVLCIRADLRMVFCYRRTASESAVLVKYLRDEVIHALPMGARPALDHSTIIVVGSRDDAATFPYGFFKWWQLEPNIGAFHSWP